MMVITCQITQGCGPGLEGYWTFGAHLTSAAGRHELSWKDGLVESKLRDGRPTNWLVGTISGWWFGTCFIYKHQKYMGTISYMGIFCWNHFIYGNIPSH